MQTVLHAEATDFSNRFLSLTAAEVMQIDLITVLASDPLREAERVLAEAKVGAVPVLDDHGQVLGMLTVRDVVGRHAADEELDASLAPPVDLPDDAEVVAYERLEDGPVAGDVMNTDVVTVPPTLTLRGVAWIMADCHVHQVLVAERGRYLGILSATDVLRALAG